MASEIDVVGYVRQEVGDAGSKDPLEQVEGHVDRDRDAQALHGQDVRGRDPITIVGPERIEPAPSERRLLQPVAEVPAEICQAAVVAQNLENLFRTDHRFPHGP